MGFALGYISKDIMNDCTLEINMYFSERKSSKAILINSFIVIIIILF